MTDGDGEYPTIRGMHEANQARFLGIEHRLTILETYAKVAGWGAGIGCTLLGVLVTQGFMR